VGYCNGFGAIPIPNTRDGTASFAVWDLGLGYLEKIQNQSRQHDNTISTTCRWLTYDQATNPMPLPPLVLTRPPARKGRLCALCYGLRPTPL